jgi:hypothetical protein
MSVKPSHEDWRLLFMLAGTGMEEYPWGWEEGAGWPEDATYDSMACVLGRLRVFLKEAGLYP